MKRNKELAEKLENIKSQITSLGHEYFQGVLPMELSKAIEDMKLWGDAEESVQKLIYKIEPTDLPF